MDVLYECCPNVQKQEGVDVGLETRFGLSREVVPSLPSFPPSLMGCRCAAAAAPLFPHLFLLFMRQVNGTFERVCSERTVVTAHTAIAAASWIKVKVQSGCHLSQGLSSGRHLHVTPLPKEESIKTLLTFSPRPPCSEQWNEFHYRVTK